MYTSLLYSLSLSLSISLSLSTVCIIITKYISLCKDVTKRHIKVYSLPVRLFILDRSYGICQSWVGSLILMLFHIEHKPRVRVKLLVTFKGQYQHEGTAKRYKRQCTNVWVGSGFYSTMLQCVSLGA